MIEDTQSYRVEYRRHRWFVVSGDGSPVEHYHDYVFARLSADLKNRTNHLNGEIYS